MKNLPFYQWPSGTYQDISNRYPGTLLEVDQENKQWRGFWNLQWGSWHKLGNQRQDSGEWIKL